jgi:hypothetical protein
MKVFIRLALFAILFAASAYAGTLPIQNPDNGHWYSRIDANMSWQEAKENALAFGGYLATISSQTEQDFLWINLSSAIDDFIWLGGTDEVQEGTWKWVTGETFWIGGTNGISVANSYENWARNSGQIAEPDNIGSGQDYLAFFPVSYGHGGGWDDYGLPDYNHLKPSIIEWDSNPTPVPESGSTLMFLTVGIGSILAFKWKHKGN